MALSSGWTIDYTLDVLTMSWLRALREHWRVHPPVHKMVAAFAGFKPQEPTPEFDRNDASVRLGQSILAGIDRAAHG